MFIGGSLALGTALALPGRALAATATASAGSFFQTMGVNVQTWYAKNAWSQRLLELGVPHIRTNCHESRDFVSRIGPWLATGGKINSIISTSAPLDKDLTTRNLNFLKSYVGLRNISGIEGPNEHNGNKQNYPNWAADLREFVQWTHATVRADPACAQIPLIAPSLIVKLEDYRALGDVSQYVDRGNIHFYSGRLRPTLGGGGTMPGLLADASTIARGRPIWMTESGWQALVGNAAISLKAQAKYLLRNYFDAFGFGVEKLFSFQLMDNISKLFGLCNTDASPKPSFYALKNLAALFKDSASSPRSLSFWLSSAPSSLKTFTFSKSDGSFLLAFYLDVDSFDPRALRDIETNVPVTFHFPIKARKIEVYQPTFSANKLIELSGMEATVSASDEVTVLKIWL
ncbi:MAG: hypothetical protein ABIS38_02245 [Sphingomicrobium sp.]